MQGNILIILSIQKLMPFFVRAYNVSLNWQKYLTLSTIAFGVSMETKINLLQVQQNKVKTLISLLSANCVLILCKLFYVFKQQFAFLRCISHLKIPYFGMFIHTQKKQLTPLYIIIPVSFELSLYS